MASHTVLETLRIISKTLNKGMNLQEMLQHVLEKVLEVTKLECGWIFLVDDAGKHTLIASAGLPPSLAFNENKLLCEGGCWCKEKYVTGRLIKAVNIIECQRIERVKKDIHGDTLGISHHATVPIFAGNESFGLMNVAAPHKSDFSEEELDLLEMVAYQIGATVKRVTLLETEQRRACMLNLVGRFSFFLQEQEHSLEAIIYKVSELFSWSGFSLQLDDEEIMLGKQEGLTRWRAEASIEKKVVLTVYHTVIDEVDREIVDQLVQHISLQIEKNQLVEQKKELVRLNERNRLARDLHDSVNQLLFSISLTAKGAQKQISDQTTNQVLGYIQELSQEALKSLKQSISQLRSVDLEDGMIQAIKRYSQLLEIEIEVSITGLLTLSERSEECLWRVAQEALNNVKKHSGVQTAVISIEASVDFVVMKIHDQGIGAVNTEQIHPQSTGIKGMKERVELLNGSFEWTCSKNKGTMIKVVIPNR